MGKIDYKNIGTVLWDDPKDLEEFILELKNHSVDGWKEIFFELKSNGKPIFYLQRCRQNHISD